MPKQKTHKPTRPHGSWHDKFLEELKQRGIVRDACAAAHVDHSTAYDARNRAINSRAPGAASNDDFASRWDDALDAAIDRLEGEAWRRGVDGLPEPVFYRGEKIGAVKRYSDGLLTLLLKAHRPKKFRDVVEYTHELSPETHALLEKYYTARGIQPPRPKP